MRPILFPFCLALSVAPAAFAGPPVDGIVDIAFGNAGSTSSCAASRFRRPRAASMRWATVAT
jgi:hypothetical protein